MCAASNAGRKKVIFRCKANPGDDVRVAGSFNGWNPTSHPLHDAEGDGTFTRSMYLSTGRCEYKYIINGVWCIDGECPDWIPNEMGSLNSLKFVR